MAHPKFLFFATAVVLSLLFSVGTSQASLIFNIGTKFNGNGTTYGPGPWVKVSFNDVSAGQVSMTISADGLIDGEKIGALYLNLDPALDPVNLMFTETARTGSFTVVGINTGTDAYKADGDGLYDIKVDFDTDGPSRAFNVGDSITYNVSLTSLSESSFDFWSADAPGQELGPYQTAIDILSPGGQSDYTVWATTPEPVTFVLLGLGAFALRRRK
jgi:hypothetical protein